MAMSEARKRANEKWNKQNMNVKYDSIHFLVPKGKRDIIQAKAKEQGLSTNKYIMEALRLYMGEEEWEGGSDSLQRDDLQEQ